MKARALLLVPIVFLSGCLFAVNQPLLGPEGAVALFLAADGTYSLFSEEGTLHLLRDGRFVPIATATLAGPGGVLDWSPDGSEILFLTLEEGEGFGDYTATLSRVAAAPEAESEVLLRSRDPMARAAFTSDGRILVLRHEDRSFGALELLDPETRVLERVADDVLSFRLGADRETLTLLIAEEIGSLVLAHIGRLAPRTDERVELGSFVLNEQTLGAYSLLSHDFLWDVDRSGRWIALSVYDQVLIEPAYEDEVPALYLIDTEEATSKRLTRMGIVPRFSPDGRSLAYLTSDDGELAYVAVRDLEAGETMRVAGGDGAATCFWLGVDVLGLAFEAGEETYRIVRVDLETGETTVLVP